MSEQVQRMRTLFVLSGMAFVSLFGFNMCDGPCECIANIDVRSACLSSQANQGDGGVEPTVSNWTPSHNACGSREEGFDTGALVPRFMYFEGINGARSINVNRLELPMNTGEDLCAMRYEAGTNGYVLWDAIGPILTAWDFPPAFSGPESAWGANRLFAVPESQGEYMSECAPFPAGRGEAGGAWGTLPSCHIRFRSRIRGVGDVDWGFAADMLSAIPMGGNGINIGWTVSWLRPHDQPHLAALATQSIRQPYEASMLDSSLEYALEDTQWGCATRNVANALAFDYQVRGCFGLALPQ